MARQIGKNRTALALYSLLLVLPTFVLGGLNWRQLRLEQELELAEVPALAEAGTRRLITGIERRLTDLLEAESNRPFTDYQERFYPEDLIGPELALVPSSLSQGVTPRGVLGWYAWDFRQINKFMDEDRVLGDIPRDEIEFELFPGLIDGWEVWEDDGGDLKHTVREFIVRDWKDGFAKRVTRYDNLTKDYKLRLSVAVINLTRENDYACLLREKPALRAFDNTFIEVFEYGFHVRFFLDEDGTPRIMATRRVFVGGNKDLVKMPACYANLKDGATLVQGFFIDPAWLFGEVPLKVAAEVLRDPELFHPFGSQPLVATPELLVEKIYLVDEFGFETSRPEDSNYGEMQLSINLGDLLPRHERQRRGFLGVAFMLLLSLGTGMVLLLRSVQRELDQAQRTENFVAAVTHELRTPVAAIRLYGEMLRDGWAATPAKQEEYYGRIVQESLRLETMVERVLESSQVAGGESRPRAGDLNEFLEVLVQRELKPSSDLHVELAPGLPKVLMTPESIRSIVINLVENARKYAPARAARGADGKIQLRTLQEKGTVYIETLDRGPGVPDEDKALVFEAFYRRGDEATRTAKGTGLGLHLVKVQAQSIGGDVTLTDRPGGGCQFRVRLAIAEDSEPESQES
ncbi:MAG: two-component system sensor histidine kinase CiaH [Candidatus Paceibacteria bacterium]